jgi:hypothetical protein
MGSPGFVRKRSHAQGNDTRLPGADHRSANEQARPPRRRAAPAGAARGTCGPILARLTPQALWAPIGVSFTPDLATIERICSSSRPARDKETFVA